MNQQGTTAAQLKTKTLRLSLYTHTLKTPTSAGACSTLTLQVSQYPETPPAVITAVCCIPAAEHLKNDKNGLLGWLKGSQCWVSLGAINQ